MDFDPVRAQLQEQVARLQATVEVQAELIAELRAEIAELRSKNEWLHAQQARDSATSSTPPSRDSMDRRARRATAHKERRAANKAAGKAARSPGKQKGDPGATLCRRRPDRTIIHRPQFCPGCGAGLGDAAVVGTATRQVLDIPEPTLMATDHVALSLACSCGCIARGEFPTEATGPVCWGPRVRATAAYLLGRQHLPLERAGEAMADLFAAPVGEGTLAGLLLEAAGRLAGFMAAVRDLLATCPVVHADETSMRVGVAAWWVHTVSTPGLTHLALHEKRGIAAMVQIGVLTACAGTIVHDGFASYDTDELAEARHAQCGAHLLRHLDALAEHASQTPWAMAMKALLHQVRDARQEAVSAGLEAVPATTAAGIAARYDEILSQALLLLPGDAPPRRRHWGGWTNAERDAWNLATRMRDRKDQVLALLYDCRIPFTNNEAERSVRMAKLHDKISGHSRNPLNAEAFLTVRSYLQTGAKHGQRAMDLLVRLWTPEGSWLPSVAEPAPG